MEQGILNEDGLLGLALDTAKCFQEARLGDLKLQELAKFQLDQLTMDTLYKESLLESDQQVKDLK